MQTPVLALIVRRDDEIRTFKPEPFWELLTRYREVTFKFAGERFAKEEDARTLLAAGRRGTPSPSGASSASRSGSSRRSSTT